MQELPSLEPFEIEGFTFDPNYYLTAEYIDIDSACRELPPIIEWINEKLQTMIEEKMHTDNLIRRARAKAYFDLKTGTFLEKYHGKMTEIAVDKAVDLDMDVQKHEDAYARLYAWCNRLNNIQASLRDKLNLVRSAESTRRALIQNENSDSVNL